MPACKPWGRPENTKGMRGNAPGVQGPATNILGGPLKPPVCRSRNISTTARVRVLTQSLRLEYRLVKKNASARGSLVLYTRSRFWMQGEFATDCDGSAKHGKWKEPAGTLLFGSYRIQFLPWKGVRRENIQVTEKGALRTNHLSRIIRCLLLG